MTNASSPILKYRRDGLLWDCIKGSLGLALVALPLIFGEPVTWLYYVLLGLCFIFIIFLGRNWIRYNSEFQLTGDELSQLKPQSKKLSFKDLQKFKLRYYSTKRSRDDGWMFLQLKSKDTSFNIDSHLDGFEEILKRAALGANMANLNLDPTTIANLSAADINLPEETDKKQID